VAQFVFMSKAIHCAQDFAICLTCQKAHGGPYFPFVVFRRDQVEVIGDTIGWRSTAAYDRRFCRSCGSPVASVSPKETELSSTSFEEPGLFPPNYESWTIRRVPWVTPLDIPQYERNRDEISGADYPCWPGD
jgi:hypothetical protein